MRSLKFLAALAIPAMFAACTKEELYDNSMENTLQKTEEVVGVDLIGTDVSMGAAMPDAQTKVQWAGGWHSDDVIGLGWVTYYGPGTGQNVTNRPNTNTLYANHMFAWDQAKEEFSSRGNLYKGWYFAYYPWGYESKIGPKTFVVNPAQVKAKEGQTVLETRKGQSLQLSSMQFLTNDGENPTVVNNEITTAFPTYSVFSHIVLTTNPVEGSSFAEGGALADLKIKSVNISVGAGKEVFAEKVALDATKIPAYNETDDKEALIDALYTRILTPTSARISSVKTDVEDAEFVVSGKDNQLITIVAPTVADIDKKDVEIVIEAASGKFVITYTDLAKDKLTAVQKANNEAIEALVAGYKVVVTPSTEGTAATTTAGAFTEPGRWKSLKVVLGSENFVTDFSNISNIEEWKKAVDLVDAIGYTNQTFKITGAIDFENGIYMPKNNCKITVTTGDFDKHYFNIKRHLDGWPANLTATSLKLVVAKGAVVTNAHLIKVRRLYNDGTVRIPEGDSRTQMNVLQSWGGSSEAVVNNEGGVIELEKFAKLSAVTNNGEIVVKYGSVIEPKEPTTFGGVVTYEATELDETNPERIKRLITRNGQDAHAYVNNIIVPSDVELDFTRRETTGNSDGSDDVYMPSAPSEGTTTTEAVYGNLEGVDFVINGGSIKSTYLVNSAPIIVKNVTMNGGNAGANITMSSLTIEGGKNTVEATAINGDVTVEAGEGTITVTGDITGDVTVKSGNYDVNAKNVNGDVFAKGAGTFNVTEKVKGTFYASGNYTVNAAEISGDVSAEGENSFLNVKKFGGNLTLTQRVNASSLNGSEVAGDVTLNGAFDVHNVTAKNMKISGAVKLVEKCTISGDMTNAAKNNVVVAGTKIAGDFTNSGKATLQNTTVGGVLTNESEVTISGETTVGSIVNNGTLTSSVDLHVIDVTLNEGSTTVLSSNGTKWDRTIWYTGKYVFDQMTLKGTVVQVNAAQLTADINAAIAAAANGTPQTVTLKGDVTLDEALTFTAPLTRAAAGEINVEINLNGYTIENKVAANTTKLGNVADECIVFYVDGEGMNLTIDATNGGKVIATGDDKSYYNVAVWAANGAKVTIKGGEYYNTPDPDGDGCDLIYARNGANIFVEGGTFKAGAIRHNLGGGIYGVLNCKDASSNIQQSLITVSGGNFYQYGAAEAAKVGSGEVILVKEGYKWTTEADADGYYSVVAK